MISSISEQLSGNTQFKFDKIRVSLYLLLTISLPSLPVFTVDNFTYKLFVAKTVLARKNTS